MRQLIKTTNSYQLYINGALILEDFKDWREEYPQDFTQETLDACFALKCEEFGLNADGTEPA